MGKQSEISQPISKTLYEAALNGDVNSLREMLKDDKFILERCIIEKSCNIIQSPLHVSVKMGHLNFVEAILREKPELAEVTDQLKRSTPLHIAAARRTGSGSADHLKIVELLIDAAPIMCFMYDHDGLTPLHVAAINGNTQVLQVFLRKMRQAALERTTRGGTILHLCVKNSHYDTLKALVDDTYDLDMLNSEDSDGNTVLHLAVAHKEAKMVEFLLLEKGEKIDKNAMNKKNKTVRDIFDQTKPREVNEGTLLKENEKEKLGETKEEKTKKDEDEEKLKEADKEIEKLLKKNHASRAKKVLKASKDEKWLEEQNTALMVVASCIATLSFQVGINPPGSVWQDNENGHQAGTSIMSYGRNGKLYNIIQVSNTIGLISSLSVILLLISGLPCRRYFVFVLRVTLWIAVTASATTYLYTIGFMTSDFFDNAVSLEDALDYSVEIWLWLILIILFGHVLRLIWKMIGYKKRSMIRHVLQKTQTRYCPNNV